MPDGVVKRASIAGAIYVALAAVLTVLFPWGWVGWWGPAFIAASTGVLVAISYFAIVLIEWVAYGKDGC